MLVLLLLTIAAECLAAPSRATHVLHEKRSTTAETWRRSNRVQPNDILPIRIGLSQNNLNNAVDHLMDVSHPSSPNFGKHWTAEQVHDMFAPSSAAIDQVRLWLTQAGIEGEKIVHSKNKGWLAVNIPAWQAEEIFQTEYHEHEDEGAKLRIGCDQYHIPKSVAAHIDYVTPGVALSPSMRKSKVKREAKHHRHDRLPNRSHAAATNLPAELQECTNVMTPACLRALYSIPVAKHNDSANSFGIFASGDKYDQEDLDLFFAQFAPNVPQHTSPILKSIDGGFAPVAPSDPDVEGESVLDLSVAFSLVYPQTVTLYQADDEVQSFEVGGFNTFLDALDGSYCTYEAYGVKGDTPGLDAEYPSPDYKGSRMCGTYKPTKVISISVGINELGNPPSYTRRQCNEFLKLGLQGVTVVQATGDYGVASNPGVDSPSGCLRKDEKVFNPGPSCPWVTLVGATRLWPGQTVLDKESALSVPGIASNFGSAGGFSNYFTPPTYQRSAVSTYFSKHDPGHPSYKANARATNIGATGGIYNRNGRGIPDVSANGANFPAFKNLTRPGSFGTSISAPIWGSMITLINQERTAIGKGSVGFLNPILYENSWVFNDIVNGSNSGCGTEGFAAVPGWDPVTGLGTPSYPKMLSLLKSLP